MDKIPAKVFIINIEDIQEEGLHVAFNDIASIKGFDLDLPEGISLNGPFAGSADFYREGRYVHLTGEVTSRLMMSCHRCLDECTLDVSRKFYYMLQPAENDISDALKEISLGADDLDVWNFTGGIIRLDEIFREQLLLEVPIKALCDDSCRGICPGCGNNLNSEKCTCDGVPEHSPFAVLKGLTVKQ